jgi:bifunctional non-homologous end joining protein LigD
VTAVEVDGRRVAISNPDKLLWRDAGWTKRRMLDYYLAIAPVLLAHVARRPVTLGRFPDGVEAGGWYQNECRGSPEWLATHPVELRTGAVQRFCVVNDVASLAWVANQGAIELHPFLATIDRPDEPAAVVLDLDPGPPADIVDCARVAGWLRSQLARVGLDAVAKTSGSTGLHVFVPLNEPHAYAQTKAFARSLAARAAAELDGVVDRQARSARRGNVLVDWLQNDPMRSTVAPYSLRGTAWPTVSTPITWAEVERCAAAGRPELLTFDAPAVLERVGRLGDLFAPALELRQRLPS